MRATFKVAGLLTALRGPSLVESRSDVKACLFSFHRDTSGRPRCSITSRRDSLVARGTLALDSLDGEGVLAFPTDHLEMLRTQPPDDVLDLEYTQVAGEGFRIHLSASSGLQYDHQTYDPQLISPCDKALATAMSTESSTLCAAVLGVALGLAQGFLPTAQEAERLEDPAFQTVRLFDPSQESAGKSRPMLFACDHNRAFSFECDDFAGDFVAHRDQIATMTSFLGACSSGHVTIWNGPNISFAADADRTSARDSIESILGWARPVKTLIACRVPPADRARFRLRVSKETLVNAIDGARVTVAGGAAARLRVRYVHAQEHLIIAARESAGTFESARINVRPHEGSALDDFNYECNLRYLLSLVSQCKGQEVTLRINPFPVTEAKPRAGAGFYTVDEFVLDARGKVLTIGPDKAETVSGGPKTFACRVTRFMSSLV